MPDGVIKLLVFISIEFVSFILNTFFLSIDGTGTDTMEFCFARISTFYIENVNLLLIKHWPFFKICPSIYVNIPKYKNYVWILMKCSQFEKPYNTAFGKYWDELIEN